MTINHAFLMKLRILGIIEGTSTLILFGIAMPPKYFAGIPEAVTLVGSLHGALVVALVAMFDTQAEYVFTDAHPAPACVRFRRESLLRSGFMSLGDH